MISNCYTPRSFDFSISKFESIADLESVLLGILIQIMSPKFYPEIGFFSFRLVFTFGCKNHPSFEKDKKNES